MDAPGSVYSGTPVTERILQHVGELAVPVGNVGSALRQGPQDVCEGGQAPVYTGRLPQG